MDSVHKLTYSLLRGEKPLRDLTPDECIQIIETFYGNTADEYREVVPLAVSAPDLYLPVLQHGVKVALNRAGDSDEYYEYVNKQEN